MKSKKQKKDITVQKQKNTDKRISCPYCSEQILFSAKKCRFCGEWVGEEHNKKEEKSSNPKIPFLIWVLSLIVFHLFIYFANQNTDNQNDNIIFFILGDVFVGFLAFSYTTLIIFRNLIRKVKIKKSFIYLFLLALITGLFFYSFTFIEPKNKFKSLGPDEVVAKINDTRKSRGSSLLNKEDSLSQAAKSVAEKLCEADRWGLETDSDYYRKIAIDFGYENNGVGVTMTEGVYDLDDLINVWITSENTKNIMLSNDFEDIGVGIVRCGVKSLNKTTDVIVGLYSIKSLSAGTVKKNGTVNNVSTNKPNPKTPVHCKVHENCGGGTTPLTQEECDNSTCCQTADGWKLMLSKSQCDQAQGSNNNQQYFSNSKKVQYTTRQAIIDGTYYCYEDKVNEISRYEQSIELKQYEADACNDTVSYEAKNCSSSCTNSDYDLMSDCINNCYSSNTKCKSLNEEVGNMRRNLYVLLSKYCP